MPDADVDLGWLNQDVTTTGTPTFADLTLNNLPVADPHIEGALWNDSGTLKVSAG